MSGLFLFSQSLSLLGGGEALLLTKTLRVLIIWLCRIKSRVEYFHWAFSTRSSAVFSLSWEREERVGEERITLIYIFWIRIWFGFFLAQ